MKTLLTTLLLVAIAGSAFAQGETVSIQDIRTGLVPAGTECQLSGTNVVTSVRYNGFSLAQVPAPSSGFGAIWVYTGTAPTCDVGDYVYVYAGEYKEYYDLSELDMTTLGGTVTVTSSGNATPKYVVSLADALANAEAYESHILEIAEEVIVTEFLDHGEWYAESVTGDVLYQDDYFFDETTLALGDCYTGATGLWTYAYGDYKLNPFSDGITAGECVVANEALSFGEVKALYR